MRSLSEAVIYGILDLGYIDQRDGLSVLQRMIDGGVDLVQLRGKNQTIETLTLLAKEYLTITSRAEVPLIINDHAKIAREVELQGVHVGQDDDSVANVRTVSRPIIVGKSTHTVEQAIAAEQEGADYIGFGPIFATPTKPDYRPIGLSDIREVHRKVAIPVFCIGGIKLENLSDVIAAGAQRVVIVSGILQAADVRDYVASAKALLTFDSSVATPRFG